MCLRITWGVPSSARREQLAAVAEVTERHGLAFSPEKKAKPPNGFPADFYLGQTRDHCDCGTVLGSRCESAHREDPVEREIAKRRKKGWSQSKIDRWLSERGSEGEGLQRDLLRWQMAITELVSIPGISRLALLIHEWNGNDDVQKEKTLQLNELDGELLARLEVGVLYMFCKSK